MKLNLPVSSLFFIHVSGLISLQLETRPRGKTATCVDTTALNVYKYFYGICICITSDLQIAAELNIMTFQMSYAQ